MGCTGVTMNLFKPGDMFHYAPHRATGVLLKKEGTVWIYCLRSPSATNRDGPCRESIKESEEEKLMAAVNSGALLYFSSE